MSVNRDRLKISAQALADLEQRLSEPRFYGVPLGSSMGTFYASLFVGNIDLKPTYLFRIVAGLFFRLFFPIYRKREGGCPAEKRSVLCTWISNTPRTTQLMLPVIRGLGASTCMVIGKPDEQLATLGGGVATITWEDCVVDRVRWRREYCRCAPRWNRIIFGWLSEHKLPLRLLPLMAHALLVQSQRIVAAEWLIESLKPKVILTEFDRYFDVAPLVLAAKQKGVRSITLVHGVTHPPVAFIPVLADVLCCWGEEQKEQFSALGCEASRIRMVGYPRLTRTLSVDRRLIAERMGIGREKRIVLLASAPIEPTQRIKFVEAFGTAMRELPGQVGVVRLHPSEKLEFYEEMRGRFPDLLFTQASDMSVDESLALADVAVVHNSGFANDALVKSRLVVVADVLDVSPENGLILADKAGSPCVHTAEELAGEVNRILSDDEYAGSLKAKADKYVAWSYAAFDDQATENIVREVTLLAKHAEE